MRLAKPEAEMCIFNLDSKQFFFTFKNRQMNSDKKHDILIWGATGYVGKLVAAYLASKPPSFSFAIAGRNAIKLEALQKQVKKGSSHEQIPIYIANTSSQKSLNDLAKVSRVIISTVGPYLFHGEPLVQACLLHKTHYLDLTGETAYIMNLIQKYHKEAVENHIKIIPSCGFDSLPFDMGVFMIADELASQGLALGKTQSIIRKAKGAVSGGTLATLCAGLDMDWSLKKSVADPFVLCEPGTISDFKKAPSYSPFLYFDSEFTKTWQGYFVMEHPNTRYVRRSASLLNYGSCFQHAETWTHSSLFRALLFTFTLFFGFILLLFSPIRWVVGKLYPPGYVFILKMNNLYPKMCRSGPSKQFLESGYLLMEVYGLSFDSTTKYKVTIEIHEDAGYANTCKMISEAALALVLDSSKLQTKGTLKPLNGGVLTCSSGLGRHFIDRLKANVFDISIEKI